MPKITIFSLDFLNFIFCLFQFEKKSSGYYTFCKLIVVGKENYNYFVWSKSWLIQIQSGKFVLKIKAGSPALAEQDFFGTGTEIKWRAKVILVPFFLYHVNHGLIAIYKFFTPSPTLCGRHKTYQGWNQSCFHDVNEEVYFFQLIRQTQNLAKTMAFKLCEFIINLQNYYFDNCYV